MANLLYRYDYVLQNVDEGRVSFSSVRAENLEQAACDVAQIARDKNMKVVQLVETEWPPVREGS